MDFFFPLITSLFMNSEKAPSGSTPVSAFLVGLNLVVGLEIKVDTLQQERLISEVFLSSSFSLWLKEVIAKWCERLFG
jgi:hypothetical protein